MIRVLVCYYTRTKHTQHMAKAVAKGVRTVKGVKVDCLPVAKVRARGLLKYDGIIMGSPTYYGTMAAEMKTLIDKTVAFHGELAGKVGGAFSSSANVGGGNETTVMDILKAMLIHGMVVPGMAQGDHYGPVAVGDLNRRSESQCVRYGRLVASLAAKLHG